MIMLELGVELANSQSAMHVTSSSVTPNRLANVMPAF